MWDTATDDADRRQLPFVSLIFACEDAVSTPEDSSDLKDIKWELKMPLTAVQLPTGAKFPFEVGSFYIYAQLTDGAGDFTLRVEARLVRADGAVDPNGGVPGTRVPIRPRTPAAGLPFYFPDENRLVPVDEVFHMRNIPFAEPGLYEFAVMANYVQLPGQTALLRVLDRRVRL